MERWGFERKFLFKREVLGRRGGKGEDPKRPVLEARKGKRGEVG